MDINERELFNKLHNERLEDAKIFNKPDYRGFWTSITDKYKEKAHFVYELLQNADDARAKKVVFQLKPDCLVFRHDGSVQFSVSDVDDKEHKGHINSITGIGFSTKVQNINTIGKFGVGFKAVFQYTNEPYIYDDKFWFKIEQYIVPTALEEDYVDRQEGETVFVFPLKNSQQSYDEISKRLLFLDNPILFLHNLEEIKIDIQDKESILYTKKLLDEGQYNGQNGKIIFHELISIGKDNDYQKIHMLSTEVFVDEDKKRTLPISVGYFLNENGDLDVSKDRKVFCFFSTEENFGLKCVVHAPFLLVDSRQNIKADEKHNIEMKEALAKLTAEALVILRDYGKRNGHLLVTENIFDIIPRLTAEGKIFREEYIAILRNHAFFLNRKDEYVKAYGSYLCRPRSMMDIITDQQLSQLTKKAWGYFLRKEMQKKISERDLNEYILRDLGVQIYDGEKLAKDITPKFMEEYGIEWAKSLYAHLSNRQIDLWKWSKNLEKIPVFCLSPIIYTSEGEWLPPYQENGVLNVYLPLNAQTKEYHFISDCYKDDANSLNFFHGLGMKKPDEWDYIQNVILKRNHEANIDVITSCGDLEFVYQHLNPNRQDYAEKLKIVSEKLMLIATNRKYCNPSDLYDDTDELKEYFRNNENVSFVDYSFYQDFRNKYTDEKFRDFIRVLGVAVKPKILKIETVDANGINGEIRERISSWRNGKKYTSFRIVDFRIDGFEEWQKNNLEWRKIELSKRMWSWLIDVYFGKIKNDKSRYIVKFRKNTEEYEDSTTMEKQFISLEWIVLRDGRVVKPCDASFEDLEEAGYEMNLELIKYFGIKKKARSLEELGATEEQIEENKLGQLASKYGVTSEEELKAFKEWKENAVRNPAPSTPRGGLPSVIIGKKPEQPTQQGKTRRSLEERIREIEEKFNKEAEKCKNEERIRDEVMSLSKYTKIWFDELLELEYSDSIVDSDYNRKPIKIVFGKFSKEYDSNQFYILSNPSRSIPMWIEDVENLDVKLFFSNEKNDDLSVEFDVASVKSFVLKLKVKKDFESKLKRIDCSECTKAVIEINNPGKILGGLKSAFTSLEYKDDFNFKTELANKDITFVFGPPGTGKTTRLAKIIKQKMKNEPCRILVLAPTNKACDVLTNKLMDIEDSDDWLGRFVLTGDERVENSDVLIDRESKLWQENKCCIVATIARFHYDTFIGEEKHYLKDIQWDCIIVDEASMIPLVQLVYVLYKVDSKTKFIIAGDPLQIPPIVKEELWKQENIYTMVNLNSFESPCTEPKQFNVEKLETQYRSIPSIGILFSKYSYGGILKHNRTNGEIRKLPFGELENIRPVTFIPFHVEKFDGIFSIKKLQGSNVHIYSALFTVETSIYIAKQQTERIRIGIICPYAAQAQLINKLIEQREDKPENIDISVGTIHGFQGDQCEIILAVFNPPPVGTGSKDRIMLNNKNIINVAISRASDYLFILLPHLKTDVYENLIELKSLCGIVEDNNKNILYSIINSERIEQKMWEEKDYIEKNTSVTTHQLANVYTSPEYIYEVRIDENAVDIQVRDELLF